MKIDIVTEPMVASPECMDRPTHALFECCSMQLLANFGILTVPNSPNLWVYH